MQYCRNFVPLTMRNQYFMLLAAAVFFLASCKKDSPAPAPVNPQPAQATFSLVSSGGNCSNTSFTGTYAAGVSMDASNKLRVQVNVTVAGTYSVSTTFSYGMTFSGSGTFTSTGIQDITLQASGTPTHAGTITIPLTAGSSMCSMKVFVAPPSIGTLLDNDHMLLGNPSNAAMIIDSTNNYLMRKTYYAVSYSKDRGTPNWVSWHLFNSDIGSTPRQDDFRPDDALPLTWYHVSDASYNSSGFDRGHNCPSGDRTSTVPANSATFLMTNMIPQAPFLNQQPWEIMEDSLRRLVTLGNEIYIIMGSYGTGGTGTGGFVTTIDNGHVTVPANVWKVAVVIPNGNNDISRVSTGTRVIAVNMPNTVSVNSNWKTYRVSVDAIEAATGYDLLNALPASLQNTLEAVVDNL